MKFLFFHNKPSFYPAQGIIFVETSAIVMQYQYIPLTQQTANRWSGGTTTQLYIYPQESNYHQHNFLFRISSATVEQQESLFTSLQGFSRHLMVLKGEMEIIHRGHHQKKMSPFDTDFFMGDWETSSKGCVTDFNLMLAKGWTGKIESIQLNEQQYLNISANEWDFVALYAWSGIATADNNQIRMGQGDFILFDLHKSPTPYIITANENNTILVCCYIRKG